MGRKLDMSNLTEEEAEHVLQVVQRDMQLRKKEEERLGDLKQELDKEESRCVLLSRQCGFNERCCIRCCSSFTFFLKPRRRCFDCRYNVCKRCCSYSETDNSWLCSACEKSRLLKTQSLEWFYSNVRRRFRRFGSAKVLKMLYRRHIGDQGSQAEFTEGSTYAESTDDSVYESDSTFYKHTEERSMAESISVALRVAKEAIDEAITKAEKQPCNQEKLKEAGYLRENRGELIDELTTMILQTIICKNRDLSETHTECTLEPPPDQNSNPKSGFSMLTEEILAQHDRTEQSSMLCTQGLNTDEVSAVESWNQNMDWKENSCASSVLQSPDGNWFALQSTQLSRLSLPTKRENLMFSALEKESGVISAYEKIASDTESDSDGAWGVTQVKILRKLSASNLLNDHHATSSQPNLKLPSKYTAEQPQSDSDQNNTVREIQSPSLCLLKRKVSLEDRQLPCQCLSAMGITVNPYGGESSEDGLEDNRVRKTRRRRRNKRESREGKGSSVCSEERLSLSEPQDYGRMLLNYLLKSQNKRQSASEFSSDETMTADTPDSVTPDILKSGSMTPNTLTPDAEDPTNEHNVLTVSSDMQLTSKPGQLSNQVIGTQRPVTENGIDGVEEPLDERNKESEKEKEEGRVKGRRDTLSDMEVDVKQKGLDMKEDTNRKHGKGLLDVDNNKTENTKWKNSETLSTNMFGHLNNDMLRETVAKENATKINRAFRMSQKELYDCKIETKSQLYSTDNINEACLEPDAQSLLEITVQSPIQIVECSQECSEQNKCTEYKAENDINSVDNIGSKKTMNKKKERLTYHLDIPGEGGKSEYKQKTENVVKGLNITDKEPHISNTIYIISDLIDDCSKDEIMEKQDGQNQIPQVDEMGFHTNTINMNEQAQENDVENERKANVVDKTEAKEFEDRTLKDVQGCSTSGQDEFLSPEEIYKKYSAASLRSITTEVLKVLNATEDLIQGAMGQSESSDRPSLPPTQSKRLDEQLSRIEENVYVAASAVFGLEGELGDLEGCARSISGETTEAELSQLEEQVASAAAQVHQSELQVTDIAARIAALKSAGLNVAPQTRFFKPQTIDSSRKHRRRLPAPPMQGQKM